MQDPFCPVANPEHQIPQRKKQQRTSMASTYKNSRRGSSSTRRQRRHALSALALRLGPHDLLLHVGVGEGLGRGPLVVLALGIGEAGGALLGVGLALGPDELAAAGG
eukprot:545987-Rhodomonas_salina.1